LAGADGVLTMTITLPPELERAVTDRAAERKVPPDEIVRQALVWYLQIEPDLLDELTAVEEAHAEALQIIEDSLP
jgi:predicted transcriptional regulator